MTASANSMYSFFNHSCEANMWFHDPSMSEVGTSRVIMHATKDIKEGEEVFTTYIDIAELGLPREERWEALSLWMGDRGCRCTKCCREM